LPAYFIKYSDETGPKTHEFSSGELILGRAPDCQVVLKDFGISRQHAKLIADPGGVRIMDLGSKNGTKINGNLITQAPLREGDKFSLGSLEILFGKTAEAKVAFDDEPIEASGTIVRSVGDLSKLLAVESKAKPGQTASALSEIARANQILKVLTRVAETLVASRPVEEVLHQVMDIVFESIPAERGFLMLAGEEKDASTLTAKVTKYRNKSHDRGKITISKTIAQRVLSDRVAILTSDALADARFNSGDSIRINQIRSAMVAPLWNREEVIGIIHLDTSALTHAFTENDLDLLSALANFAAVAIERSRLNEKIALEEKKRERLGRFLSPQVASRIIATSDSQGFELGEPEVREVSVLFADIVGFTSMSERMTPSAIALVLNDYLSRMTEAIFLFEGTLDKYIGDAIMAVFGAPLDMPDHAARAVRTAIEMRNRLAEFNADRKNGPMLQIRIGINSGKAVAGEIGSVNKREYTVLGDTVNTASRLESSVAKPGLIVIGPNTYDAVHGEFDLRPMGEFALKGKENKVIVYEVLGSRAGAGPATSTVNVAKLGTS
jgi:adenylate cyclase